MVVPDTHDELYPGSGHRVQAWEPGLTEPAGTGPDTAGTGGTGPARYRFRPVRYRPRSKF
jgi:hypothetical protein